MSMTETIYVGRCKAVGKVHGLSMFGHCNTEVDPTDGYFCAKHLQRAKRQVKAGQITWSELLRGKRRTKRTDDKTPGQEHLRDSALSTPTDTQGSAARCSGPALLPPDFGVAAQGDVPEAVIYEHLHFSEKELAETLVVGNSVKVAYWHPIADFTETIQGTVMDLDFHGAVRIVGTTKDNRGRNYFLKRDNIRSPKRRRILVDAPPTPVDKPRGSRPLWNGMTLDDFIRSRVEHHAAVAP
jgi:hypothetical protein